MFKRTPVLRGEEIVLEYLNTTLTLRYLATKYGVKMRTIQGWVRKYRKGSMAAAIAPSGAVVEQVAAASAIAPVLELEEPVTALGALKKRLAQLSLKNELLEEILRLSSEQAGIDFKKKYGSRQ